ncbi:MAG: glycosyltransferase family 2 protein, partial [Planctomycetota bacterium]
MGAPPLVTVAMAVRNGAGYLAESVESILGQTLRDIEVVIVDDHSTDETPEILARYEKDDPRLRVLRGAPQGLVHARNLGCRAARGRYLAIMDADDVSLPDRLERQFAIIESRPRLGALGGAMEHIDSGGRRIGVKRYPTGNEAIQEALLQGCCIPQPAVMLRREAYEDAGGYRHAFPPAEDYDLWLRIAEGWEVANLPDVVVRYRVYTEQTSSRKAGDRVWSSVAACASAVLRRWTGTDPMEGVDRTTPELLLNLCAKVLAAKADLLDRLRCGAADAARLDHVGPGRAPAGVAPLAEGLMRWYVKAAAFETARSDIARAEAFARSAREIARSAHVSAKSLSKLYREAARVRWSQSRPLDATFAAQQALLAALVRPGRRGGGRGTHAQRPPEPR